MKALKYTGYLYTAVIAVFLAILVSRVIEYNVTRPLPPPKAVSAGVSDASRMQTVTAITERNLFDVDKAEPVPAAGGGIGAAAQATPFNAKLTGILLAKVQEDSRAIIVADKDVYVLNTYEEQDGYKLKAATYDTAVILYNGREYTLVLEHSSGPVIPAAPAAAAQAPAAPVRPVTPAPAAAPSGSGSTQQFTVQRGELIDQLKDINSLVRSLQISPMYQGSEYLGYRVTKMNDDSPVKQLGLQLGDVINRINGEELSSPEPLFAMMGKIDEINAVTIDITRNGEKKTLFVEIQ